MRRRIRRQDILDAGRELMFVNGYNGTGIKDITERVDIPKGSFYNHFKSKEEFAVEVVRDYAENGTAMHRKRLLEESPELSPIERLETMYARMIENYERVNNCKLGCIMSNFSSEMADVNENFREVLDEGFEAQQAAIIECLEQAKQVGEISDEADCKVLGSFIINSWHGALMRMKATANTRPLEDFIGVVFNTLQKA